MSDPAGIKLRYRTFADRECRGYSEAYYQLALAVAEDDDVVGFLSRMPVAQPNLFFASVQLLAGRDHMPSTGPELRQFLRRRGGEVGDVMRSRRTQTNEVGRCAVLLPALPPGPLALIEVGASAGLCLFPDRYDYEWSPLGGLRGSGGPLLGARATGDLPVPAGHPHVAWRGGVDLNPLDVSDPDAMAWLENLVWPEQDERRERLRAAVGVARREPPAIRQGDLLDHVADLVDEAAPHGTPVVLHSAVIAYLEEPDRERFHDLMSGLVAEGRCRWISNEGRRVLPRVTGGLEVPSGRFVTALDGTPVAYSHGHGHAIDWR